MDFCFTYHEDITIHPSDVPFNHKVELKPREEILNKIKDYDYTVTGYSFDTMIDVSNDLKKQTYTIYLYDTIIRDITVKIEYALHKNRIDPVNHYVPSILLFLTDKNSTLTKVRRPDFYRFDSLENKSNLQDRVNSDKDCYFLYHNNPVIKDTNYIGTSRLIGNLFLDFDIFSIITIDGAIELVIKMNHNLKTFDQVIQLIDASSYLLYKIDTENKP
jgi:hypothetical protein